MPLRRFALRDRNSITLKKHLKISYLGYEHGTLAPNRGAINALNHRSNQVTYVFKHSFVIYSKTMSFCNLIYAI